MKTNYNAKLAALAVLALSGIGSLGLTRSAQADPYDWNHHNQPGYYDNGYRPEHHRDNHRFDRWYHHDHGNGNKKLVTGLALGAVAGVLLSR